MGRVKSLFVQLAVAVMVFAYCLTAHSASYNYNKFTFIYSNSQELTWAKGVQSKLDMAFQTAKTVVGRDYVTGQITVSFYSANDRAGGWASGKTIKLNTYYGVDYKFWGQAMAHELTHVLFNSFTNWNLWNTNNGNVYYGHMLTEALAFYAGNCVYADGPKYSDSFLRSQIMSYSKSLNSVQSWWGSGKIYNSYYYLTNPTATDKSKYNMAIMQLTAMGSFLAQGNRYTNCSKVTSLLDNLRSYTAMGAGYGLRSNNSITAESYFEKAFFMAYGKYANAAWIYTGSAGAAYKNTKYLYGDFYKKFYL